MTAPIGDNEIRIIGRGERKRRRWWPWVAVAAVALAAAVGLCLWLQPEGRSPQAPDTAARHLDIGWLLSGADTTVPGVLHRTAGVDSAMLHIYMPLMATPELMVGVPDSSDESILFATLAADLRRDNGRIVGAFVYHGEPLSWGLSKRGYCAIIDGRPTVGVADNSPLFEQATETGGDFFRQYAAVDRGVAVENNPENSAMRRALCVIDGRVCIVCSDDRMTMNAFADRLAGLGVSDAIFLVGGGADGWYRDADGRVVELGRQAMRKNRFVNYIVFRQQ